MKATHFGTCQICFSRQKLPNGHLAKHGYTTRFGFFEGTCYGSDHLPYEISCDLISEGIVRAKAKACNLRKVADHERQDASNPAWVRIYRTAANRDVKSGYFWEQVEISTPNNYYAEYTISERYGFVNNRHKGRIDFYNLNSASLEEMIAHQNSEHAKFLEHTASQIDEYIVECEKMIRNWKPCELSPVK